MALSKPIIFPRPIPWPTSDTGEDVEARSDRPRISLRARPLSILPPANRTATRFDRDMIFEFLLRLDGDIKRIFEPPPIRAHPFYAEELQDPLSPLLRQVQHLRSLFEESVVRASFSSAPAIVVLTKLSDVYKEILVTRGRLISSAPALQRALWVIIRDPFTYPDGLQKLLQEFVFLDQDPSVIKILHHESSDARFLLIDLDPQWTLRKTPGERSAVLFSIKSALIRRANDYFVPNQGNNGKRRTPPVATGTFDSGPYPATQAPAPNEPLVIDDSLLDEEGQKR